MFDYPKEDFFDLALRGKKIRINGVDFRDNKIVRIHIYHYHGFAVRGRHYLSSNHHSIKLNPITKDDLQKALTKKYGKVISRKFRKIISYISFQRKDWEDVLPKDIAAWAWSVIRDIQEEEEMSCCDNFRVANLRKSSQVKRYKAQRSEGCCGYCDQIHICPIDNKRYLIGFNYGH